MIILRLSILVVLFLLLTPVRAQRVVIVCLHPELMEGGVPALTRQTADLGGAQALVLSRVASSPWRRSPQLSQEQWERSAYLTLNAGARALAPQDIPQGGIERLLRLADVNRGWGYPVVFGLLPEELKARGVQVRYLVARDHSPVLLAGAPFPERDTRVVSGFRALIRATEFTLQGHSRLLLWLDPGFVAPKHQREMLAVLRQNLTSPSDKLYLLLPIPSSDEAKHGSRLGWVLRLGREDEGVLTSRSTRLPGLITLPDLTATWLAHFGGERLPDELLGSPARCVPAESPSQSVGRLTESMMRQAQWNRMVGTLPTVQLLVLVAAWLIWHRSRRVVRPLWLFPCLVPVLGVSLAPILLCLPLGGVPLWTRAGVWAVALAVLLAVLSRIPLRNALSGLAVVLLVFVGVDLLHGGNLLRWSGFGYVLMEGARYYGVGNELAGSVIGAQSGFLLSEGAGWGVVRWLATALALGAPSLGANTGAMLSAMGVAGVQALRSRRALLWGGASLLVLATAVVLWEMFSAQPSHLGAFLRAPGVWAPTLWRKLGMNVALLTSSAWTPLLLFGLWGLRRAPVGVWVGALALLALNDSGVVACGTMLVWWWAWKMSQNDVQRDTVHVGQVVPLP